MTKDITPERIDELLRFLPEFTRPDRQYAKAWQGGRRASDGAIMLPYPEYEPDVIEFFGLAAQPCWQDHGYYPSTAAAMLKDDAVIKGATLEQVRTMLTCCVRGERFCDGYWEGLLESGRVVALLERLAVIRAGMAGEPAVAEGAAEAGAAPAASAGGSEHVGYPVGLKRHDWTPAVVSSLAALHLGVTVWHGRAHGALGVSLPAWKVGFVYSVIVFAPAVAALGVWTRHARGALALFFAAMLGSLLFGVYHHYVAVSPDHIQHLPAAAGAARQSFVRSAAWLAAIELIGSVCAAVLLSRKPRERPAGPDQGDGRGELR